MSTQPQANPPNSLIPKHGGYKNSFISRAEIIDDATIYFTKRFCRSFDRTID